MSVVFERDINRETVIEVAKKMALAARTAPKGRGIDNLEIAIVDGDDIKKISEKMKMIAKEYDNPVFLRDAESILKAEALFIIGTRIKPVGLKFCGLCGMANCAAKEKNPRVPCVFNTGDLGIAMGSAVSVAADSRVDTRIMYTAGMAVATMGILPDEVKIIYAIPVSATSKNPFFDRNIV